MASDWNEELDKYENSRSFGEDLRDSLMTAGSVASKIISFLPKNTSDVCDSINALRKEQKDREDRVWQRNNYIDPFDNSNN
ncbi:hypothetical protein FJW01_00760 [Pantoea deleyi]|uniref:Uncharacterized protein n=1 Tax=Pantoea deleyi TaxID=470932 RepID=A0A506QU33_9GAMM|nr:hypothetical protein [Pantoea deleyi]TPV49634.1 hypothetical protein FJW01_00760 [Pantoea deleyi]